MKLARTKKTIFHQNSGFPAYNPHRTDVIHEPTELDKPSIPDIAHSLSPVDRDQANVEAEVDEIVIKPDLMGLYKVKGKKHSQGGTPLSLDPGSFIFSNDPTLAIDKEEAKLFDLEDPKRSIKQNTPAKVLLREINPKKYNALVNTMNNPDADKIAKVSAALMLEKHQQKIGRLAFLQESKKDAPIPDFAMGTAPSMQYDTDELEEVEDMYAKKGGLMKAQLGDPIPGAPGQFNNMFTPNQFRAPLPIEQAVRQIGPKPKKKKTNPIFPQVYPGGNTEQGLMTPTGYENRYDYPYGDPQEQTAESLAKAWDRYGINIRGKKNAEAQGMMYDWALQNNPELIKEMWATYGNTAKGLKEGLVAEDLSDANLKKLRSAFTDGMFGVRQFSPARVAKASIPKVSAPDLSFEDPNAPNINIPPSPAAAPENIPSLGYDIKGKLTGAQLAHLGTMGLNAMSINKYYPKREQVDLPEVNLDTINEQPYINDVNTQSAMAYNAVSNGDPRMARVNASNIYGKSLDAISKVRGNIQNQNTQIQNQENLTNLQQRTNQVMANTQYDDRYYDQVQDTRENFDKEKRYATNAFTSQLNQYQSQADQLAWGLASVNKYGRRLVTDPKTGKKYYKPVPLYEATGNGIRYNSDVADINLASGADRINSAEEAVNILKQNGINVQDYKQVYAFSRMMQALGQAKNPLFGSNPLLPNQ